MLSFIVTWQKIWRICACGSWHRIRRMWWTRFASYRNFLPLPFHGRISTFKHCVFFLRCRICLMWQHPDARGMYKYCLLFPALEYTALLVFSLLFQGVPVTKRNWLLRILKALLVSGANPNKTHNNEDTPLSIAVKNGDQEVVNVSYCY